MSTNPLHQAALTGDLIGLQAALSQGVDANQADGTGNTALHLCAGRNVSEGCQLLLLHGANPNAANPQGLTPLHFTVLYNAKEAAKTLLANGADPQRSDLRNRTVIDLAKEKRNEEMMAVVSPMASRQPETAEGVNRLLPNETPSAVARNPSKEKAAKIKPPGTFDKITITPIQWFYGILALCAGLFFLIGQLGGVMSKFKEIGGGIALFAAGTVMIAQHERALNRNSISLHKTENINFQLVINPFTKFRALLWFVPCALGLMYFFGGFMDFYNEVKFGSTRQKAWEDCRTKAYETQMAYPGSLRDYLPYTFEIVSGGQQTASQSVPGRSANLTCVMVCAGSGSCVASPLLKPLAGKR